MAQVLLSLTSMFCLELGVDLIVDSRVPPGTFRPFSVFGPAHMVIKSVFLLRKTQDKQSTTKSVAKSVLLGRKIHRKLHHNQQKNLPSFHLTDGRRRETAVSNHHSSRRTAEQEQRPGTCTEEIVAITMTLPICKDRIDRFIFGNATEGATMNQI